MPGALPCPDCGCDPGCHIYHDVYNEDNLATDYDQRIGSWSVDGSASWLEPSGFSNSLIVHNTQMPTGMTTLYMRADCGIDSSNDRARLVFCYTDDNTYWYAEVSHNTTTGLLKLFEVSGGSPTQRGSTQNISDFGFSFDTPTVEICVESGNVTVNAWSVVGNIAQIVYAASPTVAGTKCGFSGVVHSFVRFDNLFVERHVTELPCTAECGEVTSSCASTCSATPESIQLVLSGSANPLCNLTVVLDECSSCSWGTCNVCGGFTLFLIEGTGGQLGARLQGGSVTGGGVGGTACLSTVLFESDDIGVGAVPVSCTGIVDAVLDYVAGLCSDATCEITSL